MATLALILTGVYIASPIQAAVPLEDSSFDATDGNQINDGGGETDWVDLAVSPISDNAIGKDDNSLAGGTKDNTECPSTTTGSIPPNKDDLRHWYFDSDVVENQAGTEEDIFFYLGYVREVGSDTASAHGVFELNQLSGGCPDIPGKGQQPPTPSLFNDRDDDDVRLLFDYEGGDNPVISYQLWNDTTKMWSSPVTLPPNIAAGSVNSGDIADVLNGGGTLTNREFAEVKINMSEAGLIPEGECQPFAEAGLFTGASGNSDNEQSKDFIAPVLLDFDFCGELSVNKYIDANEDGVDNDPAPVAGDLLGWAFTIRGPDSTDVLCTGTTDSNGDLTTCLDTNGVAVDLSALAEGEYTIEETDVGRALPSNSAPTINTDPGSPYIETVTVDVDTPASADFGNTCTIGKTFQITSVPDGTTGLSVWYDTTVDGAQTAGYTTVTVTDQGSGLYEGDASERFRLGDTIEWGYQVGTDVLVEGSETFGSGDGYPACHKTNTREFDDAELTIVKLKDIRADGDVDDDAANDNVDFPIENWEFIVNGPGITDQHVFTDAAGQVTLTGLAPGLYTVDEVAQTNWTATNGTQKQTTLAVDGSDTLTFLNAPEASFDVTFNDLTGFTDATITCDKTLDGNGAADSGSLGPQSGDSLSSGNVLVGTYECTIVIVDP